MLQAEGVKVDEKAHPPERSAARARPREAWCTPPPHAVRRAPPVPPPRARAMSGFPRRSAAAATTAATTVAAPTDYGHFIGSAPDFPVSDGSPTVNTEIAPPQYDVQDCRWVKDRGMVRQDDHDIGTHIPGSGFGILS